MDIKSEFSGGKEIFFIEINGKKYLVDKDGFLLEGIAGLKQLDSDWQKAVMKSEGIKELTADHLHVIDELQKYYKKNGIFPKIAILHKVTGKTLKEIYKLFPSGPRNSACKMAGLPKGPG